MEVVEKQKLNYMSNVTDLGDLKRKIDIIFDKNGVENAMVMATTSIGKDVKLNGFRKGKAPWKLVRNSFRTRVELAASSILSQQGFVQACYENKIQPLSEPDIKEVKFEKDGSFKCSIEVEIKPQIELTGYVGLQLDEPKLNTQIISDRLLDELRWGNFTIEDKDDVELDHDVILDFKTIVGDEIVAQQEGLSIQIQKGGAKPFGENLLGMKKGEAKNFTMVLPENFDLHGGKDAEMEITIKSIFKKIPATDEELIEKSEVESFDKILQKINEEAEGVKNQHVRASLEEQIINKLLDTHIFEVPKKWVESEVEFLIKQLNYSGEDDELKTQIDFMADRNVRRTFILDAIYEAEPSLAVTQEEFDSIIQQEALKAKQTPDELLKQLQKQNRLDEITSIIKNNKIMNFLLSSASIQKEQTAAPVGTEIME